MPTATDHNQSSLSIIPNATLPSFMQLSYSTAKLKLPAAPNQWRPTSRITVTQFRIPLLENIYFSTPESSNLKDRSVKQDNVPKHRRDFLFHAYIIDYSIQKHPTALLQPPSSLVPVLPVRLVPADPVRGAIRHLRAPMLPPKQQA